MIVHLLAYKHICAEIIQIVYLNHVDFIFNIPVK